MGAGALWLGLQVVGGQAHQGGLVVGVSHSGGTGSPPRHMAQRRRVVRPSQWRMGAGSRK